MTERYRGRRAATIENAAPQGDRAAGGRPHRRDLRQGRRRESAVDAAMADDRAVGVRRRRTPTLYGERQRCAPPRRHHGAQPVPRYLRPAVGRGSEGGSHRAWRGLGRAVRAARRAATRSSRRARFPIAGLEFERRIALRDRSASSIRETLENIAAADRAIGWTQHVTLGPPFLERGIDAVSRIGHAIEGIRVDVRRATIIWSPAAEFDWPMAPTLDGRTADLRVFSDAERSSAYTAHLMDRSRSHGLLRRVLAGASSSRSVTSGRPADFPWMGIWEENHSRLHPPWNGRTIDARNGVRRVADAGNAAGDDRAGRPVRRAVFSIDPAGDSISVEYCAIVRRAARIPESLDWPA